MQRDRARIDDTKAWLSKADRDLRAAAHLLQADPPFLADVAFHCQQAAEKSLKALLTWHDQPFGKTHNLEKVGSQAVAVNPGLEPIVNRVTVLSEYASKFRYPGEPDEPTREETDQALALARELHEAIRSQLASELEVVPESPETPEQEPP